MSAELPDSGRASDAPTPVRKEKKRVGWHASSNSAGGESSGSGPELNIATISASPSPQMSPGMVPPGAPDARELSRALTRVLSQEAEEELERMDREQQFQTSFSSGELSPNPAVRRPRPALRRNTSYDAPREQEEADKAEEQANERVVRSINDARHRAHQLAVSLSSHSAPGSRRNSHDRGVSFQSLVGDSDGLRRGGVPRPAVVVDDYDEHDEEIKQDSGGSANARARADRGSLDSGSPEGQPSGQHVRHRAPHSRNTSEDEHEVAAQLVRSHTRRRNKRDLFQPKTRRGRASGTSTPVLEKNYVQDYVPRPSKYRGGVLSTLLKLYNDDQQSGAGEGGGSNNSSGFTTPATASPVLSPESSPPASRSSSRVRSPRSGRSSGLFNLHRSRNSTSSLALTELMKSSSMFAAPGSSEISDRVADKLRREVPKSKKDKHRITVHIAAIIARHRYLIKLCRALMLYGAPTHRLEEYLVMSARVLEIEGQFLYIPSCMIISFDDSSTHTTEVKIVRVPQGIDLGRLRDVHNIYKEVVRDKLGVDEATDKLDKVLNQKPKFNVWVRVFLYGVASACVAPFAFQGRLIDLPFAFLLGALVGLLQLVFAPSNELYAHVFEVSAAMLTSFLARAFGSINGGQTFCFGALAQSSIALILPGYMVLCSSLELQSHNLVAGSVRMVHAMIYTLFLGYGITIGASLYGMLDSNASSERNCHNPIGKGWHFAFVPAFALCLALVNQSKWRQTPVMLLMAVAGWSVNSYTSQVFNKNVEIPNMLGALTIGILANLYSRLGRHVEHGWLNFLDFWDYKVRPRLLRLVRKRSSKTDEKWDMPSDTESRPGSPVREEKPRRRHGQAGYSLAAAAMLPAIFVQVPSGLAINGSLLAGVTSADEIVNPSGEAPPLGSLDGTAFNVLFKVIQVAIGISVGLFMAALIVYPLGKRRSGLFAF
jgi:uncharacterized membrane protein YjjP (DUF1212 family)